MNNLGVPKNIYKMLEKAHTDETVFPSTTLYKEGWMLRIALSAQSEGIKCLPFTFLPGSRWFSEALIGSPFLKRHARRFKRDPLYEKHTHLDASVGQFDIRPGTKTGLELRPDSTQFVAIEAKMFSPLSKGITNDSDYDQAARIVACVAWAIEQANRAAEDFESLGFYVIAPRVQIREGIFSSKISESSIKKKVERRIGAYSGDKRKHAELQTWYRDFFLPTFKHMEIGCVAWEDVVEAIDEPDIREFYDRCLRFNVRKTRRG